MPILDNLWPEDIRLPAYDGGSIANILPTVAKLFDVPFEGLPPLRKPLWQSLSGDVRRVVVLLLDAFGHNLVRRQADRLAPLLARAQVNEQLTSVFPSTTVNALSALWTGRSPAQHGLVGLRLFFPELATMGQMIALTPTFSRLPDALVSAGLEPKTFLRAPGGAQQLARSGITTYSLKYYGFVKSALSLMQSNGVGESVGVVNMADMAVHLRDLLENAMGYWHSLDTLSHQYGPFHEAVALDLEATVYQLEQALLSQLSPEARRGTVFIITGDHGQIVTPRKESIRLKHHDALNEQLLMRPAGEPRVPYFYARQGRVDLVRAYLEENFPDEMLVLSAREALEHGLLGPPPHDPVAIQRLGDVIAVMRHGYSFLCPDDEPIPFIGRHGSLHPDEMEVAWIGMRLDR